MEKGNITVTEGRIVTFIPSEKRRKSFKNNAKKSYPAIITEINNESIDLTVFGVREIVFVSNVQHSSDVQANHSSWDWPERK